jgi:hypothetical protein
MIADLLLSGMLNLMGDLKLAGTGGLVKVKKGSTSAAVLVESTRGGANQSHGQAPAPVPIPPPPATPSELGLDVWIFKSFNSTVTAGGKKIVAQGMCSQGDVGRASWPGMVLPSIKNTPPGVTINNIPVNIQGDMGVILPTGGPVPFNEHRQ